MSQWFYVKNSKPQGPISETDLLQLATSGEITRDTLVWTQGEETWVEATLVEGLFPPEIVPPPIPVTANAKKIKPVSSPVPGPDQVTHKMTAEHIPTLATAGEVTKHSGDGKFTNAQLYDIGKQQKILQWLCFATIVINIVARLPFNFVASGGNLLQVIAGIIGIVDIIVYCTLATAERFWFALIWAGILVVSSIITLIVCYATPSLSNVFLGILGAMFLSTLIVLFNVLRRATKILRNAGLKVGIMGADQKQLLDLLKKDEE